MKGMIKAWYLACFYGMNMGFFYFISAFMLARVDVLSGAA
jgi:hypothetical protein